VGVFRSVDVRAEPTRGDEASRDIAVNLVHKPDILIEYGVRYTTAGSGGEAGGAPSAPGEDRLVLASAVELSNPFGWGWRTRAYSYLASDRHDWGVNLDAATLFGLRLRTQLFLFDDTDDEAQLTSRVRGVTAQQTRVLLRDRMGRRWRDRLRLQWGYTIKNVEYWESADRTSLRRANRGFASLAAIGDERDSLTDPKRGLFWTAAAELARTSLGSEVDYLRLYGQLFTYLNFGPVVWAQGFRLGTVPGTDPLLLVDNRFHAGGPTTVRGFEQNSLELQSEAGDPLGGQAVAVFNQELRFPIWKTLHGGVFWDAGYAWPTSTEFDLGELRHSAGIGLRFMFPFGPVRLEYAWVLKPKPGESKGRFVFGLGHAF
jgi:outer membrane protein assembly factor BamA